MITDYKGVDLSLKKKKVKILRISFVLIILLAIYMFFSNLADKKKIVEIQQDFKYYKLNKAKESFKKIKNSFYHKSSKRIIKGVFFLDSENYKEATKIFKNTQSSSALIDHRIFLNYFIENLKYKAAYIYLNSTDKTFKRRNYFNALLSTINFKPKKSEEYLKTIKIKDNDFKKKITDLKKINKELFNKKLYYIFDMNGLPIAYYDLNLKKTVAVNSFHGYNFNNFTSSLKSGIRFYTLTFNKKIQGIIHKLFSIYSFNGSFILLNTVDNSILTAYSKNGKKRNTVFNRHYEPGSIVKLLTLYAYFKNSINNIFPYKCKSLNINNTPFYDWVSHGNVETYEQALAWSCNIGFAKMGIKLGVKRLEDSYIRFLFNRGIIKDNFINFETGIFKADNIENDYQLAKASVGLSVFNNDKLKNNNELITMTTVHSALIASTIANKGIIYSPYLIRNIKTVSSIGFYNHKSTYIENINNPLIFNKIRDAMIKVITDKSGTGKNSFVPFVKVALKTGTAGKQRPYNSILTGFLPANRPRYAFAFILEGSGPSKNKGARFLKDFLISLHKKGDI